MKKDFELELGRKVLANGNVEQVGISETPSQYGMQSLRNALQKCRGI